MKLLSGLVILGAAACSGGGSGNGPVGDGTRTEMMIGPAGGIVSNGGVALTIPANALSGTMLISIEATKDAPAGYDHWFSPVYKFGPDGTTFTKPVAVAFPITGSPGVPVIAWTATGGTFGLVATTVTGGKATAVVTHFSAGFVADGTGMPPPPDAGHVNDGGSHDGGGHGDGGGFGDGGVHDGGGFGDGGGVPDGSVGDGGSFGDGGGGTLDGGIADGSTTLDGGAGPD